LTDIEITRGIWPRPIAADFRVVVEDDIERRFSVGVKN
jgi:hypothetical protein